MHARTTGAHIRARGGAPSSDLLPRRPARRPSAARCAVAVIAAWAFAAPAVATVPVQVNYQGLLLDDLGAPVDGTVDLEFELFDAEVGGSSLWTESHDDVEVQDGVYQVSLGATSPITPQTLSHPAVFLEVSVDGETLTPRQRLLAVPYAIQAIQAQDAANLGGLSSVFLTEMYEHGNHDGSGPGNAHPDEGLGDTDGDGIANFIDADNDDDGESDSEEILAGSDINLVTPVIESQIPLGSPFSPPMADSFVSTLVTVSGRNFEAGMTVQIEAQTPTPMNVTATSFEVDIGPESGGFHTLTVTLPNGESASADLEFLLVEPAIHGLSPESAPGTDTTLVTITGQNFQPSMTVVFGSETPMPANLTPTQFEVTVGPQPVGVVDVTVTLINGESDTANFAFEVGQKTAFVTSGTFDGNLGGLAGADAQCAAAATAGGLTGTYVAYLETAGQTAASRVLPGGPYLRTDGVSIGTFPVSGGLAAPLDRDEHGVAVASGFAWTGRSLPAGSRCADWTTTTGTGGTGNVTSTSLWEFSATLLCSSPRHLYCFEQ